MNNLIRLTAEPVNLLGIFFPTYHSTRIDSLRVMQAVTDALERILDLHVITGQTSNYKVARPATALAQGGRPFD